MYVTRRRIGLVLLSIQSATSLLMLIGQVRVSVLDLATITALAIALIVSVVLLWAYQRGWEAAGTVDVVLITLLTGLGTPEPYVTKASALIVLVPTAIALILARPPWILSSMAGLMLIFSLRGGPGNGFLNAYIGDLRTLGTVLFLTGCMFLSRLVADTAQTQATRETLRADSARAEAEQKAHELAQQASALIGQNEEQRRLLELVDTLETAAVALADGVLLVPLVGGLDQRRLRALTQRLLEQVTSQRARLVVVDVAGVASMNEQVAVGLAQLAQALRLVGCDVTITGLTASVAQTLATQGIDFAHITTLRAPQEALSQWHAQQQRIP
jgi:anti-anti-sigma regulatory factor